MSTKAKKGTEQTFFDTFGDWSAADQDAALKVLNVIHDQTTRMERKLAKAEKATAGPIYPCPICGAADAVSHEAACLNYPAALQQRLPGAIG